MHVALSHECSLLTQRDNYLRLTVIQYDYVVLPSSTRLVRSSISVLSTQTTRIGCNKPPQTRYQAERSTHTAYGMDTSTEMVAFCGYSWCLTALN